MIDNISVISTFSLKLNRLNLLARAFRLMCFCENNEIELHIAHGSKNCLEGFLLRLLSIGKTFVKIDRDESCNEVINNGRLRNIAVQSTEAEFILLSDIDLLFDRNTLEYCQEYLNKDKVCMLPCVYLSRQSRTIEKLNVHETSELLASCKFKRDFVNHIAVPSSFILCRRDDYLAIGGFDEKYSGHGYEDFDFEIRLFRHLRLLKINKEMLIDEPYASAVRLKGFRAALGLYCLPHIENKRFVLHQWHKKSNSYKEERSKNEVIFAKKFNYMTRIESKGKSIEESYHREISSSRVVREVLEYYGK